MTDLFEGAPELVAREGAAAVVAAATATRDVLRAVAPAVVRDAITVEVVGEGTATTATVRLGGLSPVILQGARPHRIIPRRARVSARKGALAWSGGSHPIGEVRHPGAPARDFVAAADQAILDAVDGAGEAAVDRLMDDVDAAVTRG